MAGISNDHYPVSAADFKCCAGTGVKRRVGGPGGATESITMLVYKQGFQEMKFSYALAEAVAIAAVMIGISILQTALAERKKVY